MTTTARMPSSAAASATPCAWFPAEEQTTPRARSSSDNRAIFTSGPRSLYEPVRWNSSALSRTSKPVSSESSREVRSGVRRACRATSSCAARESGRAETLTGGASHVGSVGAREDERRSASGGGGNRPRALFPPCDLEHLPRRRGRLDERREVGDPKGVRLAA